MDTIRVHPYHKVDVNALKVDGVEITATPAEINAGVFGGVASMTNTATAKASTCDVQLIFKDADGVTMAVPTSGLLYISEADDGLDHGSVQTGLVALTNGVLTNLVANDVSHFTTTAAGLLGLTITGAADSYWIVIVLPNGKLMISGECTITS